MKFAYTILYVADVKATLEFYARAFGLSIKFVLPTNDYGELDGGATGAKLAFASETFVEVGVEKFRVNRKTDAQAAGAEIGLTAGKDEDVQLMWQKAVDAGAEALKAPAKKPWGQMVGYVRDCNGFLVEICSEMEEH